MQEKALVIYAKNGIIIPMRLFFGAFAPPGLIREVQKIYTWLKTLPGKPVELKNLHFTLVFLGDVSPKQSSELLKVGESVAAQYRFLPVNLQGWKFIPSVKNPKVLAINTKTDSDFTNLQNELLAKSKALGIDDAVSKPPHLTLVRLKSPIPSPAIDCLNLKLKIAEFSLIQSILTAAGPTYKPVKTFLLDPSISNERYRPNVSICLINSHNEVLIVKNAEFPGEHWQLPQGGTDGEQPGRAALRELKEETGITSAVLLKVSNNTFRYKFPATSLRFENHFDGQEQTPVFIRFTGDDSEIKLDLREVSNFKWVKAHKLIDSVISVRREFTKKVYQELKTILQNHD